MTAATAGRPTPSRRAPIRVGLSRTGLGRAMLFGFLADGAYVLLGGLLAVAAAWPIYQNPQAIVVGVVGVVVGVLVAVGGRILRLPWWIDGLAAVVLYFVLAVPFAIPSLFPGRLFPQGLAEAAAGVVVGWKQLVTLDLPLGDYEAVLIPLLVVTLFGAYAATRVAVSARAAAVVAPIILVAMFGFGVAFGTSAILEPYALGFLPSLPWIGTLAVYQVLIVGAVLLILVTLAWLAILSRRTRRRAIARSAGVAWTSITVNSASGWALLRRAGFGAGMILLALAVAGSVAVPAMGLGRSVIRDAAQPIALTAEQGSPLSAYRTWFGDAEYDAPLFTVTAPEGVDRLRIAVMGDYDGTQFSVSDADDGSRFTRLPGASAEGGTAVTVNVDSGYALPWIPTPGDVRGAVEFPNGDDRTIDLEDALYYADDQSNVVSLTPNGDGTEGLRAGDVVTVTGQTVSDAADLVRATAPSGPLHGVDAAAYPELLQWIAMQSPAANGTGLLDLIDALRSRGYLSHSLLDGASSAWFADLSERVPGLTAEESRSGHSVSRIEALFQQLIDRQQQAGPLPADGDQSAYVAGIGDDEQFAVAGALIAWAEGFDARVVLGVHLTEDAAMLPPDGSTPSVPACTPSGGSTVCDGRNVAAWIEIKAGSEWVPIDTSPQVTNLPQTTNEGEQPPPHGTQPERPAVDTLDPPVGAHADGGPSAADDAPGPAAATGLYPALRIVGLSAGAVGLLLLPPLVLLVAKRIRRARRRVGDPEVSIVGAWDEYLDDCVDLGLVDAPRGTRRQVATAIGRPVAAQLAAVADLAVFGETVPVETQRDLAWSLVDRERSTLRRGVPFMQRVRAALAPASFLWRVQDPAPRRAAGRGAGEVMQRAR